MTKTKFKIRTYFGSLLFEREADSLRQAVEAAVSEGVSLRGAVLRGTVLRGTDLSCTDLSDAVLRDADLSGAVLRGADLSDAVLRDADLSGAVLRGTVLRDADLSGAVLRGTDLSGAVLRDAVLRDADLRGAVLRGAVLRGAVLRGTDLSDADLSEFKSDLIAEVLKLPDELENLRDTIIAGRINGSTYSTEGCSCLAGTIAKHRGIGSVSSGSRIADNGIAFVVDAESPRERWFMNIREGDTPETNQCAKFALEWVDEAIAIRDHIRSAIPGKESAA